MAYTQTQPRRAGQPDNFSGIPSQGAPTNFYGNQQGQQLGGAPNQYQQFMQNMAYPQAMVQQAGIAADASMQNTAMNAAAGQQQTLAGLLASQYGTDAQMQAVLQQGPNNLAQALASSVPPSQASMYGSNVGAVAGQNIAQMGNEARAWGLAQMLGAVQPMLQGGQFQAPNINTNYGAGVNYAT